MPDDIHDVSLVNAILVKAMLIMVILHMSFRFLLSVLYECHTLGQPCIEVPNSNIISCSNSFLLEGSLPTVEARVRSPARKCQSRVL